MSVHSMQRKRRRDPCKLRYKHVGSHEEFLTRISKSLYYGQLPKTERFSLPVTELTAELFSEVKSGRSLDRLYLEDAAEISRNACVSPASLVLAMLYLERLKISAPEFVDKVSSSQLFLVSSLVANKFLQDDGEDDEVFNSEWAVSADIPLAQLNKLEKEFLAAINWEVYVDVGEFWKRLEMLEEEIALRQGSRRGWFSYSDLSSLIHSIDSIALAHTLVSVGAVCLTAYAASVVSMVGSTALVSALRRPGLFSSSADLTSDRLANDSNASLFSSHDEIEDTLDDMENRLADCHREGLEISSLDDDCKLSDYHSSHRDHNYSSSHTFSPLSIRCRSDCYTNETRWFAEDLLTSHSISKYIFRSVAQPIYSYIHLVSSH